MIAMNNEILIFSPNLCFHKAGKINNNKQRKQIMLQLNPSKSGDLIKIYIFCKLKKNLSFLTFHISLAVKKIFNGKELF